MDKSIFGDFKELLKELDFLCEQNNLKFMLYLLCNKFDIDLNDEIFLRVDEDKTKIVIACGSVFSSDFISHMQDEVRKESLQLNVIDDRFIEIFN